MPTFAFFERRREWGALFIRLAFGAHLMWVSTDLFSRAGQHEFAAYLGTLGVPFPLLSSFLSHITEFFGGLCLMLGLAIRPVSLVLIFNFTVALGLALRGQPYAKQFQAIQMMAVAWFLLFHGAGGFSLDALLARRRAAAD